MAGRVMVERFARKRRRGEKREWEREHSFVGLGFVWGIDVALYLYSNI